MSAYQLLQLISQLLFVFIAVVVTYRAVRRPWAANIDTALLFGAVAVLVLIGWLDPAIGIKPGRVENAVLGAMLLLLPYLLIRLVGDFTDLPRSVSRAAAIGCTASVAGLFILPPPYPGIYALLAVLYFAGFTTYVAAAFVRAARSSSGVTRRRMQAVAAACFSLGLAILVAGIASAVPKPVDGLNILANIWSLLSGLCYFIGFAPPDWLRRAWQEPEVRAFLGRASALPRLPTTAAIAGELERGAAASLGVADASIGLWDPETGVLRYNLSRVPYEAPADQMLGGRAFVSQDLIFSADAERDDPENAAIYRNAGAFAVLAAPITAGDKRLGVLTVYARRAPIFAEDDLHLVGLLATQAAVILESRALIDEAARVQAHEESTRLKDDFLSAAAHDLKTPLTTMVAQAQLLQHRARRHPTAPADLAGIECLVSESQRLKRLVLELLDVSRVEQGKLVGQKESVDLVLVARQASERHTKPPHRFLLEAPEKLVDQYDGTRIAQLLDNLLENAAKYSPDGGEMRVRLWREGASVRLTVADPGIGIPAGDLPHLFDRFHRGSNVDDRRFAGMGLGLFICRGIVEQHGGSIWASSLGTGQGSTFHVVLPFNTGHGQIAALAPLDVPLTAPAPRVAAEPGL